jgi:hypothetical protein
MNEMAQRHFERMALGKPFFQNQTKSVHNNLTFKECFFAFEQKRVDEITRF